MDENKKLKLLLYYLVAYLIVFLIISIIYNNFEFIYYTILILILLMFIVVYHKRIHLPFHIFVALTFLATIHIAGGNLHFYGIRLYDIWFIPGILKYDNIVHPTAIFIATLVAYNLLSPHLDLKTKHRPLLLALLLILIAMGMGALNEVVEFIAVIFLNAANEVGDYFNNAMDLVFNLGGSICANIFILIYHRKRLKTQ